MIADDILSKAIVDDLGYHHGDDGRFVPKTGESSAPRHIKQNEDARHAVFMFGGSGSGKGSFIRGYIGNHGVRSRSGGEKIHENHPEYRAPEKGFHHSRVIDSDAIKQQIPIFTGNPDKNGMYGPSGPKSERDYEQYPKKARKAMDKFVADRTPYRDVADFTRDQAGEVYSQGLTHALSSYIAKSHLQNAIRDEKGKSFIYDATGGLTHMQYAREAIKNGYHVTFHYVDTALPVAHHRNALRGKAEGGRAVDPWIVDKTHKKVRGDKPTIRRFVAEHAEKGDPIHMVTSPNYSRRDLALARALGYD